MKNTLIEFICRYVQLNSEDENFILANSSLEQIDKGDIIVRPERICRNLRFVVSGIYRTYQTIDAKEITSYFNTKNRNPFLASFVSLLTEQVGKETIECLVPGNVIAIPYSAWTKLYESSLALNQFGRKMAEFNYVLAMERIESLQIDVAQDRYSAFLKVYPNLMNQIPHHYIASYLGITPESLSRVRRASSTS